jgi:DNA-binding NtrC family response regulator
VAHLLLIDDDLELIAEQVRQAFPYHRVEVAGTASEGLGRVRAEPPDVILLDLRLPDQSGLEVYEQTRKFDARIPVIFITLTKSADAAIEAMKQGAYDYLFKPLDLHQLQRVVGEALEVARRMREPTIMSETEPDPEVEGAIVGSSPGMREVYKAIGRVAAQDVPVLITGESGTGKELVARAIYQHGSRAKAPFLALNCAAIPETLLESELFGHEKGAFTGADRRRIGKFEQCSGGTLFLDEIGDMPLALQSKVLRLLEAQTFERVGGNETIRTDVRIIAATHRDLKTMSEKGNFREDLYYRLGVFAIHLPPLRERGDDLPLLVRYFLRRVSRELGREVQQITPEALQRLRDYSWPGNIRELQSVLKQALLQARGATLLPVDLPDLPPAAGGSVPVPQPAVEDSDLEAFVHRCLSCDEGDQYAEAHRRLDRVLLVRVLEAAGGDQYDAARRLGISPESLGCRLRELGLHPGRGLEGRDEREPTHLAGWSLAEVEREHVQRVLSLTNGNREEAARILRIDEATLCRRLGERQNEQSPCPTSGLTLADAEREHILGALRETGGVVGGPRGAAVRLGMKRSMLYWKMKQLGISRPE